MASSTDTPNNSGENHQLDHYICTIGSGLKDKANAVCDLIEASLPATAIVFCNSGSDLSVVEVFLRKRGLRARRLQKSLSGKHSESVAKLFDKGDLSVLVCLDGAEDGLSATEAEIVIHYNPSPDESSYTRRVKLAAQDKPVKSIQLLATREMPEFHNLKKSIKVDWKDLEIPSAQAIATARSSIYSSALGKNTEANDEVDRKIAEQLLSQLDTNDKQKIEDLIAGLCNISRKQSLESHLPSLNDEFVEEEESSYKEKQRNREDQRRGQSDRRSDRNGRNNRNRDRGEGRDRGERRDRRASSSEKQKVNPQSVNQDFDAPAEITNRPSSEPIRLYIGQGTTHGMTRELFTQLATEFAEVSEAALKNLELKDTCGFVELSQEHAETLINNLNGIEYNGAPLPIEIAAKTS